MKNLIFGIILVLVIVSVGIFSTQSTKSKDGPTTPLTDAGQVPSLAVETPARSKNYVPFSSEVMADSISTRRVLFFYANWCPTCKAADAEFLAQSTQLPSDVTLIKVNYDDTETESAEKDLAKQYAIPYQHTFVQVDAEGNELAKWNGGGMEQLLRNLK